MRLHLLGLALLIAFAGLSRADGLLHQLPVDGSYANFELDLRFSNGVSANGTVLVKSVGQTVHEGQKCRWIELETRMKDNGGRDHWTAYKFLAPEENLQAGKYPLEKIWHGSHMGLRRPKTAFKSGDDYMVEALRAYFCQPMDNVESLEKTSEKVKDQVLELEGEKGTFEFEVDNWHYDYDCETRRNASVPFGVVKAYFHNVQSSIRGRSSSTRTMHLKLIDYGTGAKSAIPDDE